MNGELRREVVTVAIEAGRRILSVYRGRKFERHDKADGSPVTEADLLADAYIRESLSKLSSDPIVSEESGIPAFEQRRALTQLWMVDPLDGTKDFVKRTGDFTVNIALIRNGRPILGVVGAPFAGLVWSAAEGEGSFRQVGPLPETRIANHRGDDRPVVALDSRFHRSERTLEYLRRFPIDQIVGAGSALKFGRVAEGMADVYARLGRTMEWDVAAGDIVVTEAGCKMAAIDSGEPLRYNKEELGNPPFVVVSPRMASLL